MTNSIVGEPKFIVKQAPMSQAGLEEKWDVYMVCTVGYDAKGRFPMGSLIRTSRVVSAEYSEQLNMTIVTTRNSTYYLIGNPLSAFLGSSNMVSGSGIGATFRYEGHENRILKFQYKGVEF